jgi:uncharacterized membrane protein
MKTENKVLMAQARETLKGKWALAVGVFLVYQLILIGIQSVEDVGGLAHLLIAGPLCLGITIFTLALSRNESAYFEQMFQGFKRFQVSLIAYVLRGIFVILWSLLLIVPGIIAALSYAMTFYIISDNPSVTAKEAIKKSKEMMYGNKWKLFTLQLRFIGWALLCILTAGIGFLWLVPYMQVSNAKFYEDIKNRKEPETPVTV